MTDPADMPDENVPRSATPADLWAGGFPVGPEPDTMCRHCPHQWGGHLLFVEFDDDPFEGGIVLCNVEDCKCTGTWAVPNAPPKDQRTTRGR